MVVEAASARATTTATTTTTPEAREVNSVLGFCLRRFAVHPRNTFHYCVVWVECFTVDIYMYGMRAWFRAVLRLRVSALRGSGFRVSWALMALGFRFR